tara:strand:+ start:2325 stop:2672 length:348 start_codon:yes stop_codon:yes gene_type:complete
MNERPHFLFVCSRNQWRSPTAEKVYADDARICVRSAGLSGKSPRQLALADLAWADLVLVMEREHRRRIVSQYRGVPDLPEIEVLDIPDEYGFMDAELVRLIEASVEFLIGRALEP